MAVASYAIDVLTKGRRSEVIFIFETGSIVNS